MLYITNEWILEEYKALDNKFKVISEALTEDNSSIVDLALGKMDESLCNYKLGLLALMLERNLYKVNYPDAKPTLLDVFEPFLGTKEYNGVIATIQKWYYGSVVKDSWCATSLSWAMGRLGLMMYCLGGKYENVYNLNLAIQSEGKCKQIDFNNEYMLPGDIVILCYSDAFTWTSQNHVTVFRTYSDKPYFIGRGGNQNNSICDKHFDKSNIIYVWRPPYNEGKFTLESLQESLKQYA